ncbi:uncharacterized protein BDR25DRAFT_354772 [Lindgomyces ingoldianus]|uniref:Uncharacterized protein n=1 Tax=Lindgomyces ingoldianus TaxID=673940 RepID=A0ACB6QV88_9PLEO|nr:uncharacterized protein BDR25DRAFT_354772 [Lindgomyces ingoldianus]KAF2470851.1 hypothetical protein BDR25DRAFT_354772 [Lindgomyces ingoldianus]
MTSTVSTTVGSISAKLGWGVKEAKAAELDKQHRHITPLQGGLVPESSPASYACSQASNRAGGPGLSWPGSAVGDSFRRRSAWKTFENFPMLVSVWCCWQCSRLIDDAAGSAAGWSVMLLAVQLIDRRWGGGAAGGAAVSMLQAEQPLSTAGGAAVPIVNAAGGTAVVYCRRLLLMPLAEQLLSTAGGAAIVDAAGGAAYCGAAIVVADIVPPAGILPQAKNYQPSPLYLPFRCLDVYVSLSTIGAAGCAADVGGPAQGIEGGGGFVQSPRLSSRRASSAPSSGLLDEVALMAIVDELRLGLVVLADLLNEGRSANAAHRLIARTVSTTVWSWGSMAEVFAREKLAQRQGASALA